MMKYDSYSSGVGDRGHRPVRRVVARADVRPAGVGHRSGRPAGRTGAGPRATGGGPHPDLPSSQHEGALSREERSAAVLFMFDPRRQVILLLGGDKSGEWSAWYER